MTLSAQFWNSAKRPPQEDLEITLEGLLISMVGLWRYPLNPQKYIKKLQAYRFKIIVDPEIPASAWNNLVILQSKVVLFKKALIWTFHIRTQLRVCFISQIFHWPLKEITSPTKTLGVKKQVEKIGILVEICLIRVDQIQMITKLSEIQLEKVKQCPMELLLSHLDIISSQGLKVRITIVLLPVESCKRTKIW